jgi:hypothetical protein
MNSSMQCLLFSQHCCCEKIQDSIAMSSWSGRCVYVWVWPYVPTSWHAVNSDLACWTALGSEFVLFSVRRSENKRKSVIQIQNTSKIFNSKLNAGTHHNLHFLSNIIRTLKSRKMRLARRAIYMWQISSFKILIRQEFWETYVHMAEQICCRVVDWIEPVQNRIKSGIL